MFDNVGTKQKIHIPIGLLIFLSSIAFHASAEMGYKDPQFSVDNISFCLIYFVNPCIVTGHELKSCTTAFIVLIPEIFIRKFVSKLWRYARCFLNLIF